jgi:hypothetical protein
MVEYFIYAQDLFMSPPISPVCTEQSVQDDLLLISSYN